MDIASLQLSAAQFQAKLDTLYASQVTQSAVYIGLGQAVGGIGALLYISYRIWQHQAKAESIDFFPLLRPFAIGLCILFFPQMCQGLYGVTGLIAHSADAQRQQQFKVLGDLAAQRDNLVVAAAAKKTDYTPDEQKEEDLKNASPVSVGLSGVSVNMDAIAYKADKEFREWTKNMLELGAIGAQLGLSIIATFLLLMLSIVGPLAFGIAILPGFGAGIKKWFGNFISISLWLPVASIYGFILGSLQEQLLTNDIAQLQSGGSVESSDYAYLCFLLLSIVGYLFVPRAAELLIDHSGIGTATSSVMSGMAAGVGGYAGAAAGAGARGGFGMAQGFFSNPPKPTSGGNGGGGNNRDDTSKAQAFGQQLGAGLRSRFRSK